MLILFWLVVEPQAEKYKSPPSNRLLIGKIEKHVDIKPPTSNQYYGPKNSNHCQWYSVWLVNYGSCHCATLISLRETSVGPETQRVIWKLILQFPSGRIHVGLWVSANVVNTAENTWSVGMRRFRRCIKWISNIMKQWNQLWWHTPTQKKQTKSPHTHTRTSWQGYFMSTVHNFHWWTQQAPAPVSSIFQQEAVKDA